MGVGVPPVENLQKTLPMGWALKSTTKKRRFSDEQKKYLLEIFQIGEQTGKKVDPASASKMMRAARNIDGTRKLKKEDFLSSRQIAGFFSRTAAKKKLNADFDDNDDIQLQQELFDTDLQEVKIKVIDEIAVQHPIMFENFDICKKVIRIQAIKTFSLDFARHMFKFSTGYITHKGKIKKTVHPASGGNGCKLPL